MAFPFFYADPMFCEFVWLMLKQRAFMLKRVFKTQQLQLLYDHQELACTSKGSPRRVNMNEMSFRNIYGTM